VDGPLPQSVFDVREWLEQRQPSGRASDEDAGFDTTAEQLEALGYK
jgi:hypothetical protein